MIGREIFKPKGALILGQAITTTGAVNPSAPSFVGEVGQVGIWNRILSANEKSALTVNCSTNLTGKNFADF